MTRLSTTASTPTPASTMQAATLVAPRRFEVTSAPLPEPGPGQVRVRLEGCGVCASNVPPWEGRDWFDYPMTPGRLGHEGWGTIDAVGEDVTNLAVGQRVACLSDHAFAQYDIAQADSLAPLPDSLADQPMPGEPLACASNIFERSLIAPKQTVAIIGMGFLGNLLAQMALHAGARVIAISRRTASLDFARKAGVEHCLPMHNRWEVDRQVGELTGDALCPRVIEATGKQAGLDQATDIVAERGMLIVAGYHQDGDRQVNMQQWNWKGIDVINAHERDPVVYRHGLERAIQRVEQGTLNPTPLLTHTFSLHQLNDALNATAQRPEGFMKAIVRMS